jgi:hypothetical protein
MEDGCCKYGVVSKLCGSSAEVHDLEGGAVKSISFSQLHLRWCDTPDTVYSVRAMKATGQASSLRDALARSAWVEEQRTISVERRMMVVCTTPNDRQSRGSADWQAIALKMDGSLQVKLVNILLVRF